MLLSLRQQPFQTLQKSRGVSVTKVFCDHNCFSAMAMGAMAALHGLAWCLGSLQKLPQSCRAVRTGLKDNPLCTCYCEARMWLIAIRIHVFPPSVKSLYVSYNHHFWASSQPQNRFSFAISGSPLARGGHKKVSRYPPEIGKVLCIRRYRVFLCFPELIFMFLGTKIQPILLI